MQRCWSQLSTCSNGRIKIRVVGPLGVKLGQSLRKYQIARVWCKNMKNMVLRWFWPALTFGQPRVNQGHFGQFDMKWHFEYSNAQMGCAMSIQMFPQPHERNLIFWNFQGLARKSRANKLQYLYGPNKKWANLRLTHFFVG